MTAYETLSGFFEQDDPSTDAAAFDFTTNFGLIVDDSDGSQDAAVRAWARLVERIESLSSQALGHMSYRVLILGRHGQGWHNVAESKYGTQAWDAHYSKLESYDGMTFLDSTLTEKGRQQAQVAHATWQQALKDGLPAPQSYYVSPLDRCLETCQITFSGLDTGVDRPFKPKIRELVREVIGEHTCDKRRSRSYIQSHYPGFEIEESLAEDDPLWRADHRETDEEQEVRLRSFLDHTLSTDNSTYVSITAHSGAIRNMLKVLGHREFALETGGVIPMVVKVTKSVDQ